MQLRDDFAHCGSFPCPRCAGDVDAAAISRGDGGFEMGIDGVEFGLAAGERGGYRGDVELVAGSLMGCTFGVAGREEAGGQRGDGERLLDKDSLFGGGLRSAAGRPLGLRLRCERLGKLASFPRCVRLISSIRAEDVLHIQVSKNGT